MIEFVWSLLAIIVIDVVLGGENALVIAMASKNLPEDLRKKAILWGTIGAVAVRFICVAMLTYLLMIPGLRLIGGIALLYIAWKLLKDNNDNEHNISSSTTLFGALTTIVWADTVMGLDNALAIAGAAEGNWLLIILGLLISVPIILYGSTLVSKIMSRWPKTIWIGVGVLVAVALQMIYQEPLLGLS